MPLHKFEGKIPDIDKRWNDGDGLGTKAETMLTRFLQRLLKWIFPFLVSMTEWALAELMGGIDWKRYPIFAWMFGRMEQNESAPSAVRSSAATAKKDIEEGNGNIALIAAASGLLGLFSGGLRPFGNLMGHDVDMLVRSNIPSVGEFSAMRLRGTLDEEAYKNSLKALGYNDKYIAGYTELRRQLLQGSELVIAKWRNLISEKDFQETLMKQGYTSDDASKLLEMTKQIPPLADITRMMVREAWNEDICQLMGYDDDYPSEVNKYLPMLGLNEDWGKRYWRAHWTLPSPTQAYEMLHRGIITKGDLSALLKTADYPSFWRDKLEQISYNVYTRVDVRRMVQSGVMTEAEAYRAYQDMGYDEVKARKLTDFAVAGIGLDEKDLTKAEVIGLYNDGLTDRATTKQALVKMGYDEQETKLLLDRADYDILKSQRTDAIAYTKERYSLSVLNEAGVVAELTKAGLKDSAIQRYLYQWKQDKVLSEKLPTRAEAEALALLQIITLEDYKTLLTKMKYSPQVVSWFVEKCRTNMPSEELEKLVEGPTVEPLVEGKITRAEADAMLLKHVIDIAKYADLLKTHGYTDDELNLLVQLARTRLSEQEAKEAE